MQWMCTREDHQEPFSEERQQSRRSPRTHSFRCVWPNAIVLYEWIKILRSDNGGEYTSKEFVNFCKDVGIKRELTTPYNPQQNSVAERKNRTIMEAVKTMIHDQDLPM
jgi:transposase InsO family protein